MIKMGKNSLKFKIMSVRACVYKKNIVPLHAFYVAIING